MRRHASPLARARPLTWVIAALGVASLVIFASFPGSYVGDDRFEKYWAPLHRLLRELSIWDASRGLGRVREDFWPGTTAPVALLRALGVSPAIAEHLWHAGLLFAAGCGVVVVLRQFRPRIGLEHFAAGLLYMFNPYTATFLVPSGLFFNYVLAPWLLAAFVKGVRARSQWRWAAGFALLVFLAGDVDLPGLAFVTVPLVPMVFYLVWAEGVTWRQVGRFTVRAVLLTALVSAAALVKVRYGAEALTERLATTESPKQVNVASSWAESWRGLGFWLSYYRDQFGLARPQGSVFFTAWPVVLATFAVPCVALVGAWRIRWRPRAAFLAIAMVAIILMVGAFPLGHPSPYGRALLFAYDHVPGLGALRNNYKAGAGLMIGTAVLAGTAVAAAWALLRGQRRVLRLVAVVGAVCVFGLASLPFWSGRVYPANTRLDAIPSYWHQAVDWLDRQPGRGRVLVLPGSTRTGYRWGWTGDDIFDALLRRPHVVDSTIPLSTPEAANLVSAISSVLADGTYSPGELAPIARRLGIEYVLFRNDLDWTRTRTIRPARLDAIRSDPALELRAEFGAAGQNVVDRKDLSPQARREQSLKPVEIYAIRDGAPPVQVRADAAPYIVSGDGNAWPLLARDGALDDGRAVQYSGDLTTEELARLLANGSPVVITDTDRRRLLEAAGPRTEVSWTLAAGENLYRPTAQLFGSSDTQSTAVYGDASTISASSVGTPAAGLQPWLRPANAFDGNPTTAWEGAGLGPAVGQWIRADFRRTVTVSQATLVPAPTARRPTRATIQFSNGRRVPVNLAKGEATVSFPPTRTKSLEIRIDAVRGERLAPVGFSEISVPGLKLVESINLPTDIARAARARGDLRDLLARAPIAYRMSRLRGNGPQAEELTMHRRFDVIAARQFDMAGAIRLGQSTPEQLVDTLVGGPTGASASSRFLGAVTGAGANAVDGREDTQWLAEPREGEALNVRFPVHTVNRVEIEVTGDPGYSVPSTLDVVAGTNTTSVRVPPPACPQSAPGGRGCITTVVVNTPPVATDHLTVRLGEVAAAAGGGFQMLPVGIPEVRVNGMQSIPLDARPAGCVANVTSVDGTGVGIALNGTLQDLLRGAPLLFASCGPVSLSAGSHSFDTSNRLVIDDVRLAAAWPPSPNPPRQAKVEVLSQNSTHVRLRLSGGGAIVSIGQAFDSGWKATMSGAPALAARPFDTLSGWKITRPGVIDVRYAPQRSFEAALLISAIAVVACLWLLLAGPRSAATGEQGSADRRSLPDLWAEVLIVVMGFVLGGVVGVVVAGIGIVLIRRVGPGRALAVSAALLSASAILTTLRVLTDGGAARPAFATRGLASTVAQFAGILAIAALLGFLRRTSVRSDARSK